MIVIARRPAFDEYIEIGFVQISRYASHDARVAGALLESLGDIARAAHAAGAEARFAAVLRAAEMIGRPAVDAAATEHDREVVERLARVVADQAQRRAAA